MKYEKLIGWTIDTNQFTSPEIKNVLDAKFYLDKATRLYGAEIVNHLHSNLDCRFTSFSNKGITLAEFLTN